MADEKLMGRLDQTRDQIQDKLIQLNRDIRTEFDNLIDNWPEVEPPAPPPAPAAAAADLGALLGSVDNLHQATSQVELLRTLVQEVGQFLPRVLLLIKKSGNLHGWSSSGFTGDFANSRMKKVRLQVDQFAELKHVIANRAILTADFSDLSDISSVIESFEDFVPFRSIFLPLVVKNKVAAVLYADSGTEAQLSNRQEAQLLCHIAGLELTLVAVKAKVAPTSGSDEDDSAAPAPPTPTPPPVAAEPVPLAEPETMDASFVNRMDTPSGGFQSYTETEPEPPQAMDAPQAEVNDFDDRPGVTDFDMPQPDFGPEDDMVDEEPDFAEEPVAEADFGTPYDEPVFEEPAPPEPPQEEDDPATKKAKRAARVLVSDLVLYNEAAVKAARQHGDLYSRLREDIDRSYQHYQERISDLKPPGNRNFFKEEIIRQLGDGDPNVIGKLPF